MREGRHPRGAGRLGLLALAFALWTGLLEEVPAFLAPMGNAVVRLSREPVWMTPLSHLLFFGLAALVLLVLGRLRPASVPRPVVTGAFGGLSPLSLGLFWSDSTPWRSWRWPSGSGPRSSTTWNRIRPRK